MVRLTKRVDPAPPPHFRYGQFVVIFLVLKAKNGNKTAFFDPLFSIKEPNLNAKIGKKFHIC